MLSRVVRSIVDKAYDLSDDLVHNGLLRHFGSSNVRLPVRFYRAFPADYETANFTLLRSVLRGGDVALDIGAHIGVYTVAMAALTGPTGQVHSFEPSPASFDFLTRVVGLNHVETNVTLTQAAVSAEEGRAVFFVRSLATSVSNSLVDAEGECSSILVQTINVDGYKSSRGVDRIAFMKIDAEGAELDILCGSVRVLASDRPSMILGLHPRSLALQSLNAVDVAHWLERRGYLVILPTGEQLTKTAVLPNHPFDVHVMPFDSASSLPCA